jgi:hypothetical protein
VIKDHNEPTAALAYHLRLEMPGFDLFGGFVMNQPNGGINVGGPDNALIESVGARSFTRAGPLT